MICLICVNFTLRERCSVSIDSKIQLGNLGLCHHEILQNKNLKVFFLSLKVAD